MILLLVSFKLYNNNMNIQIDIQNIFHTSAVLNKTFFSFFFNKQTFLNKMEVSQNRTLMQYALK